MLTNYVPRGFISTKDAIDRLFEERHPEFVSSAPERKAEIQQLKEPKRAAGLPFPDEPTNSPNRFATDRKIPENWKRPEFTEKDKERVGELAAIEAEVHSARENAASEIRTALAEGDLSAMIVATNGHEAPIPTATWRAKGGLECVKAGRVHIQFPRSIDVVEGCAFVKVIDLITWLSEHAPKPFSKIGINILVQSPPQPTELGKNRRDLDCGPVRATIIKGPPDPSPEWRGPPRQARDAEINDVITAVYDLADRKMMKAPNVKQIVDPVIKRLNVKGLTATKTKIQTLADSKHKHRRRKPGPRLYDSLLPFCDLEM